MATYKDIASLTGLSAGTISNVLHGRDSVKPENQQKVYEAIEQLNYRMNFQARSLVSEKTGILGLLVSDLNNVAEAQILMPMIAYASRNNLRVLIETSNNDSEKEKRACESLLSSKVDGLFIFFESLANEDYFRKLAETEETPIIFLSRYLGGCSLPYVAVDNWYAAECMVDYVYRRGFRALTYLDVREGSMLAPNRNRREGVKLECEKRGMDFHLIVRSSDHDDVETGYEAAMELAEGGAMPELVFPRDDSFAVGFYNGCMRCGIRVPEDVSIMSFGNFYSDKITPRRLTTFDRHFSEVIREAIDLYVAISAAGSGEQAELNKKIFVKGSIIEGETILDKTFQKNGRQTGIS